MKRILSILAIAALMLLGMGGLTFAQDTTSSDLDKVGATGESPKVLVNNLKMQRAHDLLVNKPDMPVAQIAVHCGFTESSSFIRSFQNAFGMSPTQYRSRQHSKTDTTQPT